MEKGDVMRMALVGLLGCVGCASGRDIPVYREYTQPIFFYDERGERMAIGDAAPDVLALQSMRDTKAQEALMGKETLMEMTLGAGKSVFDSPAPLRGAGASTASGGDGDRRGKKNSSERNWLVKSLKLPNLGQESGDPAKLAMSSGTKDSSWGWLADEVAAQDASGEVAGENRLPGDDILSLTPQEMTLAGMNPATEAIRSGSKPKEESKEKSSSSAFPERTEAGQKPSDLAAERSANNALDLTGGTREASPTMKTYRTSSAVSEMSQTRKMIDEMSAGARGELASLQASIREIRLSDSLGRTEQKTSSSVAPPSFSSRAMEGGGKAFGSRSLMGGGGSGGSPAASASSWQGGWNSQNVGNSSLSRSAPLSDPTPSVVTPASSRATPLPGISSGGYKPGWF